MPIPEGINNIISVKSARQVYIISTDIVINLLILMHIFIAFVILVLQVTYPLGRITYKHVAIYWRSKLL